MAGRWIRKLRKRFKAFRKFLYGRYFLWLNPRVRRICREGDVRAPLHLYSIGARDGLGLIGSYVHRRGMIRTYGFDADAECAASMQEQKLFDVVLPYAVGDDTATHPFYLTHHPGCSSILEPDAALLRELCERHEWFDVVKQTTLQTRRLDEIVAERRLPPPELLEIDTQGYEYRVLEGCGELLKSVYAVSLELHFYPLYRGEKTFDEVKQLFDRHGFRPCFLAKAGFYRDALVEANVCFYNTRFGADDERFRRAMNYWKAIYGVK